MSRDKSLAAPVMKTSPLTLLSSLLVVLGLSSCIPMDPYYDGGGYQSGGGYGSGGYGGGSYGGSSYGNSYGGGYSQRPSYGNNYGYSSGGYGQSYGHDHHDHDDNNRRSSSSSRSSSNSRDKNDTLYRYRGKNGPDGNHTIDWWHSRGYQRSQLDFAN